MKELDERDPCPSHPRTRREDASANIARLKAPPDYGGTIIATMETRGEGREIEKEGREGGGGGRQEGSL